MTIRYYYPDNPYYESRERKVADGDAAYIADVVQKLIAKGAKILEIISPPPGQDDRQENESVEYIDGVKCYVSRVKWAGRMCNQYRFTVRGWSEVTSLSRAETKRMIRGRTSPYVKSEY